MTQSTNKNISKQKEELDESEWCHYSDMPSPYFYQIKVQEKENEKDDNRTTKDATTKPRSYGN